MGKYTNLVKRLAANEKKKHSEDFTKFFKESSDYLNNASESYNNSNYNTFGTYRKDFDSNYENWQKISSNTRKYLEYNKGAFSSEDYKSALKGLDVFDKQLSLLSRLYKSKSEYYSNFDSEEKEREHARLANKDVSAIVAEIDSLLNPQKEESAPISGNLSREEKLAGITAPSSSSPKKTGKELTTGGILDGNTYISKKEPSGKFLEDVDSSIDTMVKIDSLRRSAAEALAVQLPASSDFEELGKYDPKYASQDDTSRVHGDKIYAAVNGMASFGSVENAAIAPERLGEGLPTLNTIQEMNEDEVKIYNAIYAKYGSEIANEYLRSLTPSIEERYAVNQYKADAAFTAEHPVLSNILSVASTPFEASGGLYQAFSTIMGDESSTESIYFRPTQFKQNVREETSKDMGAVTSFLYNAGMSMADSGLAMLAGSFAPIIMGTSAASSTILSAKNRGIDDKRALMAGIVAGVAEALFEKIAIKGFTNIKNSGSAGVKSFLKNSLGQLWTEGNEEALTEITNIVADMIINGELSEPFARYDELVGNGVDPDDAFLSVFGETASQVGLSWLGGAVSGIGFGVIGSGANALQNKSAGKAINKAGLTGNVVKLAEGFGADTETAKRLGEYNAKVAKNGKASNSYVGALYRTLLNDGYGALSAATKNEVDSLVSAKMEEKGIKTSPNLVRAVANFAYSNGNVSKGDLKLIGESGALPFAESLREDAEARLSPFASESVTSARDTVNQIEDVAAKAAERTVARKKYKSAPNGADITRVSISNNGDAFVSADGKTVAAEDATVDESTSLALALSDNMSTAAKKAFFKHARNYVASGSQSIDSFHSAFTLAYNAGVAGTGWSDIENSSATSVLGEKEALEIYREGLETRKENKYISESDTEKVQKALGIEKGKSGVVDDSEVRYEEMPDNDPRRATAVIARFIAATTGRNVKLFDTTKEQRAEGKENGKYDPDTNTIYIDVNAGVNELAGIFEGSAVITLSHELVHNFAKNDPKGYSVLSSLVFDALTTSTGKSRASLIAAEVNRIKDNDPKRFKGIGKDAQLEIAEEELVARGCEDRLANSRVMREFIEELDKKDSNLAQRISNYLGEAIKRLRRIFEKIIHGYFSDAAEAKAVREFADKMEAIQKQFDALLEGRSVSEESAEAGSESALEEVSVEIDYEEKHSEKSGSVMYQERGFSEEFASATLDSFGIKDLDDSVHIQRRVLGTLLGEGFFIDSENRRRVDENEESGLVIETNKSGIDETLSFNNFVRLGKFKKIAKLATIRELPKVIRHGHIVADNVANKYSNSENKKFAYIEYTTEVDGKELVVRIAIKKSPQKNKFWVHSIYTIENASNSPASTNNGTEAGHITADTRRSVTQQPNPVKMYSERGIRKQERTSYESARDVLLRYADDARSTKSRNKFVDEYVDRVEKLDRKYSSLESAQSKLALAVDSGDAKKSAEMKKRVDNIAKSLVQIEKDLSAMEESKELRSIVRKEKAATAKRMMTERLEDLRWMDAKGRLETEWAVAKEKHKAEKKIEKVKASAEAAIQSEKEKADEKIRSQNETRERRAAIEQIEAKVKLLSTRILKNNREHHIPDYLKKPVVGLLKSIDFTSERNLKGYEETMKAQKFRDLIENVEKALRAEKVDEEKAIELLVSDEVFAKMDSLREELQGIYDENGVWNLNQMPTEQVKDLNFILTGVTRALNSIDRSFASSRANAIARSAENSITFMDAMKKKNGERFEGAKKLLTWSMFTPYTAFKHFGDGGMNIYNSLLSGWGEYAMLSRRIIDFSDDLFGKDAKKWSENVNDVELAGKKFKITDAQLMYLYLLDKRKQGKIHLEGKGFNVDSIKGKGVKKGVAESEYIKTTQEQRDKFFEKYIPKGSKQREVAEKMQRFLTEVCADWGNELTLELYGYKAFLDPDYVPIFTNANQLKAEAPEGTISGLKRILNQSFTKSLNEKATSAVIIYDIFDVFAQHTADMAKYKALAKPLLDAERWLNYAEVEETEPGVFVRTTNTMQQAMTDCYGKEASGYVRKFLSDLNGVTKSESSELDGIVASMTRAYKVAAVSYNLKVILLQPTSYLRAANVISPASLTKAIGIITSEKTKKLAGEKVEKYSELAKKYSGMALWKSLGYFDVNIRKSLASQIKHDDTILDKVVSFGMEGAGKADEITIGALFKACHLELIRKGEIEGLTQEQIWEKAGELLDEVIVRTQVVDSTITRSQAMRTHSQTGKSLTAFMSESTVSYNMVADAAFDIRTELRKGKKLSDIKGTNVAKNFYRAVGTYTVTALASAVLDALFSAWRDHEDDDFFATFVEGIPKSLLSEINPVEKVYILKDIVDAIFGNAYGSGKSMQYEGVAAVRAFLDKISKMFTKGEWNAENTYDLWKKFLKAASYTTGVGVSNAWREIEDIWKNIFGEG